MPCELPKQVMALDDREPPHVEGEVYEQKELEDVAVPQILVSRQRETKERPPRMSY